MRTILTRPMIASLALCVAAAGCCDDSVHSVFLEVEPGIITVGVRLQVGDTLTTKAYADSEAKGLFCHADRQYSSIDHPNRFTYQSTDPSVVTIDAKGFVTVRSRGIAVLTATTARVVSLPVRITVE